MGPNDQPDSEEQEHAAPLPPALPETELPPADLPPRDPGSPPPSQEPDPTEEVEEKRGPVYPDPTRRVWGKAERAELLESIAKLTVSELIDVIRRWKIVYALNGLSPEFREMTAAERLRQVDQIIALEDARKPAGDTQT